MNFRYWRDDVAAASVGALTTLPQAVAFGLIAVSPLGADWAVFGITASVGSAILFGALTGFLGSNPFAVSGPRASTALILAVGFQQALERGYAPEGALILGFAGVFVAGLFQVVAGFLRAGHLAAYVPSPVLAGFVCASAVLVLLSALPAMLGAPELDLLTLLIRSPGSISPWAAAVGGITVISAVLLEARFKILPGALAGLIFGVALYYLGTAVFGVSEGPLIGDIALSDLLQGMGLVIQTGASQTWLADADIPILSGISIGLLTSFDTALTNSALDAQAHHAQASTESDANRDLRAHGLANMIMGLFGFLPGSATLSRSTAVIQAGAKTRLANILSAAVFFALIAGLTPAVAALPIWATAGLLIVTALRAFDRETIAKLQVLFKGHSAHRRILAGDVMVTLVVVVTALAFDLIVAVGVGMVLAIALFVLGLGRDPVRRFYFCAQAPSKVQRPFAHMDWLEREGHRIAVIQVQGALFFGTCAPLKTRAKELRLNGVEQLILDCRHLTSIDSTGSALLRDIHMAFAEKGGRLLISCVEPERRLGRDRRKVKKTRTDLGRRQQTAPRTIWLNMEANGVIDLIGRDQIFDDTDTALAGCEDLLLTHLGCVYRETSTALISGCPIFADFSRDQIKVLGGYAVRHRFAAGDTVFCHGDEGDRAFFLASGRMDVLIDIPGSGRRRRLSSLARGTFFGEMGLIDGAPRSATVVATERSVCFSIDWARFDELQQRQPELVHLMMRTLTRQFATRLRVANNLISELEQ